MRRLEQAKKILEHEAGAVAGVAQHLNESFGRTVDRILGCTGNVVLTGVGKPYILAQSISSSLASTGTPSIALHPVDAVHGDLGRVSGRDLVVALSNSGSSEEVIRLLPAFKALGAPLVAITGNRESPLAREAAEVLWIGRIAEPSPLGLAPTSSSTAMLALGHALVAVLAEERGLREEDFALLHPAGALGRKLRSVGQAMRPLSRTAVVGPDQPLLEVLRSITAVRSGAAFVVDTCGRLLGIFTDGDLRRVITDRPQALQEPVRTFMTRNPKWVPAERRLAEALEFLRYHQVDELPVLDACGQLLGHLDVQDVLDE